MMYMYLINTKTFWSLLLFYSCIKYFCLTFNVTNLCCSIETRDVLVVWFCLKMSWHLSGFSPQVFPKSQKKSFLTFNSG